jgi:hypothetical protein
VNPSNLNNKGEARGALWAFAVLPEVALEAVALEAAKLRAGKVPPRV